MPITHSIHLICLLRRFEQLSFAPLTGINAPQSTIDGVMYRKRWIEGL